MVSFSPDFSNLTKFANLFSSSGGRSTQALSTVDVESQTHTGLSIITAEGDKVTLSTNASFQGTGVKYNARGVAEGQAISLRSNSLEGSFFSEKQITIEGDLSEQEIRDIKQLVNQTNELRQDVASGKIDAIAANGQQISATGTIASVNLNIRHSESVSVAQVSLNHNHERPPFPTGAINNEVEDTPGPNTSPLGFIEGLFKTQAVTQQSSEEQSRTNADASQSHQTKLIEGLNKILNSIEERILKRTRRIAELANRFKNSVEKQSEKIAQSFEKLFDAEAEGNTKRADLLRNKITRQTSRLESTTDKLGSKIERATDKLTNVLDSVPDRLLQSGYVVEETVPSDTPNPENSSPTGEIPVDIEGTEKTVLN